MGIKNLAKLLADEAPESIREADLKSLHGRKIAIDASMAIYQFLIAVRANGGPGAGGGQAFMLTNAEGETTSHIQGMFNRTIRFMTEGIRPVFVFDGKPPSIKSGELLKRREKRQKAEAALKVASEEGNVEELDKQSKRLVRAGQKENEDCRRLLQLMGVPVVNAPCEAEAQASAMAKAGTVYAAGTEDMDALTFQTPVLIRKMTFANASKATIQSIHYDKALEGLQIDHAQFVDLCILLGCDYCDSIKGVGPKIALKLIREHKNIETILTKIDRKRFVVPDTWIPNEKKQSAETGKENKDDGDDDESDREEKSDLAAASKVNSDETPAENDEEEEEEEEIEPAYVQARKLFLNHEVLDDVQIKWKPCDEQGLTKFLVDEMGFNAERVQSNIAKLQAAYKASSKPQTRVDSFFKVKAPTPQMAAQKAAAAKRKAEKEKAAAAAKRAKSKKR